MNVIFSWLVGCVKPLKFKGLLACQYQIKKIVSLIRKFLLAIRSFPCVLSCMSDLLDITPRVCASQNSAETVRFGRETYCLHSHADCGTPIYKRVYNGSCNRGGGSPWLARMIEFKTLSACKSYLAYFANA